MWVALSVVGNSSSSCCCSASYFFVFRKRFLDFLDRNEVFVHCNDVYTCWRPTLVETLKNRNVVLFFLLLSAIRFLLLFSQPSIDVEANPKRFIKLSNVTTCSSITNILQLFCGCIFFIFYLIFLFSSSSVECGNCENCWISKCVKFAVVKVPQRKQSKRKEKHKFSSNKNSCSTLT